ncbi:MAG: hypothetical protein K9M80_08700 [Candidatus Marinimicrobia bacterium]|nr:hypothetical protein [Candidatus Neomarinimicrobiota bacterium]
MILNNLNKLQNYIKNNKTPLFAYFADKILKSNKDKAAQKICIEGEKEFSRDAWGKYMRAKVEKALGNQELYFQYLEDCIQLDRGFLQAYYELISEGKEVLSDQKLSAYYLKLKHNNFTDREFLEEHNDLLIETTESDEKEGEAKDLKFKSLQGSPEQPETQTRLRINRRTKDDNEDAGEIDLQIPIPTMTFVDVLMKQELYDQALEVLDIIENKTDNAELVTKKRDEILDLKAQSE